MSAAPPPLPRAFRLRLEMQSDWHVGTGAGRRGDVDRAVARDEADLPYVPGRTLTGIWRDACTRAAHALDGSGSGSWTGLLERLFGSEVGPGSIPRPAALSVRPARLGGWLRERLAGQDRVALRDALTFVRPAVRIDPRSGRALDGHLRFDEVARTGAVLWADCALDVEPELAVHAAALLCAGALLVDRLGGGRRRGRGRCALRIDGVDHGQAVDWLAEAAAPALSASVEDHAPALGRPSSGGGWRELRLLVRLLSPASFPRGTAGNVTLTFDHLPGRLLLPALTRVAAALGVDIGPAIGSGDVRVLNGLPRIDGRRAAPVPFCLHRSKHPERHPGLRNALDGHREEYPTQQRGAYVVDDGAALVLRRPEIVARAHNAIDDDEQRAAGDGGVYTIEALPAGTELDVRVMLRSGVAAALDAAGEAWWEGLAGPHALGRSSKDDYGLAHVVVEGAPEAVGRPAAVSSGGRLRVWCLSDVLLRDELLQPATTPEALGRELGRLLSVDLRPVAGRSFVRVSRTDTWQTRWGLPRPSMVAIAAGSVIELELVGELDQARLAEVAVSGVGERRAEGFGEIRFGDPLLDREVVEVADAPAEDPRPNEARPHLEPDAAERAHARLLEEGAWRSAIHSAARTRAGDLVRVLGWETDPPASQIRDLRTAAARGARPALEWLGRLREVRNRKKLWPDPTLDELTLLLTRRDRVWQLLGMDDMPVIDEDRQHLRRQLWHEALTTLLDACARWRSRAA